MLALRSRSDSQRRLAWLLWFALLVPIAQLGAAWHAFSHDRADASRPLDDKKTPTQTHCDLCLSAAAIGSGAPLGETPVWAAPAAVHVLPQVAVVDVWLALTARAYRSRAPPFAFR